tara:strand:- start:60 stop:935 length:876 start_codon:yes stop_codon:yes gene_type:complete
MLNCKMSTKQTLRSNAKINLGLNILSKKLNGYHEIESLMQEIDFYDEIDIEVSDKRGDIEITSSGIDINCEHKNNTCYKITNLLKKEYGINNKISLKINKRIKVGSGLGGGSSNAAAVLNFLNSFFKLKITKSQKNILCQKIGMDVPFFLEGGLQYVQGMGEKLSPIKDIFSKYCFVLVMPKTNISTSWAYSKIKKELPVNKLNYNLLALSNPIKWNAFRNDFEDIVIPIYPEIRDIKELFKKNNALFSSLSGSGSTIFGVYENQDFADRVSKSMQDSGHQSIVANPIYKK